MKLKKNVGSLDKMIRYVLALVLVISGALVLSQSLWLGILMFVFAGVLTATALFSFCGLYVLFGVNTCPLEKK